LEQIRDVAVCEIIFDIFHPLWSRYLNVTKRTDDLP